MESSIGGQVVRLPTAVGCFNTDVAKLRLLAMDDCETIL